MDFEQARYTHDIPYPDNTDTRAAIKALDDEPLTVADRTAKAKAIKDEAEATRKVKMKEWGDAEKKAMDLFRADAEVEYDMEQLSDDLKGKIHSLVWSRNHDSGLHSVWCGYSDIAEIAVTAYRLGASKRPA